MLGPGVEAAGVTAGPAVAGDVSLATGGGGDDVAAVAGIVGGVVVVVVLVTGITGTEQPSSA